MVRSSSEITPEDAGSHPDLSKFGYSQKEVWNWLYTEQDLNHNLRVVGGGPRPPKDSKVCTYLPIIRKYLDLPYHYYKIYISFRLWKLNLPSVNLSHVIKG